MLSVCALDLKKSGQPFEGVNLQQNDILENIPNTLHALKKKKIISSPSNYTKHILTTQTALGLDYYCRIIVRIVLTF